MILIPSASRLRLVLLATFLLIIVFLFTNSGTSWRRLPSQPTIQLDTNPPVQHDSHPIGSLMVEASTRFNQYIADRSHTFKQAVQRYRERYGRHPPPGYKEWYKFARERGVYSIDDFDQINSDLRPFWAIPPSAIRNYAAHAMDDPNWHNSIVAIRNGHVYEPSENWRAETFSSLVKGLAKYLPDMDIALNQMDQPRDVVPWEEMQTMLAVEETSRSVYEDGVRDTFTKGMNNLWLPSEDAPDRSWLHYLGIDKLYNEVEPASRPNDPVPDYGWFDHTGQQYMDLVSKACPPDSYARTNKSYQQSEASYKSAEGLITNYNISSDLCTVGTGIANMHGLLYASTSMQASTKLLPIFSECKVSVNNDILYPANMYWKHDDRYEYSESADIEWDAKADVMVWRGATSGGTTHAEDGDKWRQMHRQKFVLMTNATEMQNAKVNVLTLSDSNDPRSPYKIEELEPASFLHSHTDIGFTNAYACIPDCSFYDSELDMLETLDFQQTFRYRYLVDIDGMSFSGRWRAYLQSKSMGLKATIFREWHDSRLFAWKHFAPMDNRFDDVFSLLGYFVGLEQHSTSPDGQERVLKIPEHEHIAQKMAQDSRAWAAKVLRREDLEIYVYRLLLEYGRIIDDNRDTIGFIGDGGKEMENFDRKHPAVP